jgi:hypothetical protein
MILKTIKLFGVISVLNCLFMAPCSADIGSRLNTRNDIVSQSLNSVPHLFTTERFSVKRGQPYDEANDPAIKSSAGGPEDTSPMHGYFSVPLIVIGLAGILLYFSKID